MELHERPMTPSDFDVDMYPTENFAEEDGSDDSEEEVTEDEEADIEIPSPLDESQIVKCRVCGCYVLKTAVIEHTRAQHSEQPCTRCGEVFPNRSELQQHFVQSHLSRKVFKCPTCPVSYYSETQLHAHIQNHSNSSSPSQSPRKRQAVTSLATRTVNENNNEEEQSRDEQCPLCNKVVASLQKHIGTHMRPFPCDSCSNSYSTAEKLQSHKILKHSAVEYQCDMCEYKYKNSSALNKHKKSVHSNIVHTCPVCHRGYNRRDNMVQHARKMHGFAPYLRKQTVPVP